MDIVTNDYGLERLFDDGASSSLPTAVDAALPAPAEKHDWSDAEELIPSQLSFKGKAYGPFPHSWSFQPPPAAGDATY